MNLPLWIVPQRPLVKTSPIKARRRRWYRRLPVVELLEDRTMLSGFPLTPQDEQSLMNGQAGVPQAVSLIVSAPGITIAGSPFDVTITAVDQNLQPVTTYSGVANLSSSDNQAVLISAPNVDLVNGTATVAVTLNTPDTLTLNAASGSLEGSSSNIDITPPVTSFSVSAPTQAVAGSPFSVTVEGIDQYGNIVSGFDGPVGVTCSDMQTVNPVGETTLTLTGGIGTFQVALNKAEANPVTLTAGIGPVEGTSDEIQVNPDAAASFTVGVPANAASGVAFGVTLTAQDKFGNTVTGYGGQVTFTSDNQTITATTVTWDNGVGTAQLTLSSPPGTVTTLIANANGVEGTSASVVIESPASQSISNGLASLASWGGSLSFPLVGTATSVEQALQVGLVNPIASYLETNSATSPGFLNLLKSLSTSVGNLTVTVPPGSVTESINGNDVTYTLSFQASETVATSLGSLGSQADGLGIKLVLPTTW